MLGINDPWIWGVYILCILSTLLCIIYGIINWNKGDTEKGVSSQTGDESMAKTRGPGL